VRVSPKRMAAWRLAALGVALLAAAAQPASAMSLPPSFPTQQTDLWLSPEEGSVPGVQGPVLLLARTAPAGAGKDLPLVPLLEQLGVGQREESWHSPPFWNGTRELVGDAEVRLSFFVSAHVTARIQVRLDDVAPDGSSTTLGSQERRASLQDVLPNVQEFKVPVGGGRLAGGHTLRLHVAVDDLDVLTWLQYGSPEAPSGLSLAHRSLDTDRDGIPDDHDPCPTEPDCDGNGIPDGAQTVHNNTTVSNGGGGGSGTGPTYHQYYLNGTLPPVPPPGTPLPPAPPAVATAQNLELAGGAALGGASLLVALGGLFGRHPL
jgi:hypothetical protein